MNFLKTAALSVLSLGAITLAASSAKADPYLPDCVGESEAFVEWPAPNTVICQSRGDVDDWTRYEYARDSNGIPQLFSVIAINANAWGPEYAYDLVVIQIRDIPITGFVFWNDLTIVPGEDANMAIARINSDEINELFRTRAEYIGY